MANIGGVAAAPGGGGSLSGNSAGGRDYINTLFPVTDNASLTSFDVGLGAALGTEGLSLKVWRVNGSNYDFIGQSQDVVSLAGNSVHTVVLDTPISVQAGDLIGLWLGNTTNAVLFASNQAGSDTINWKAGDSVTTQAISSYSSLASLTLSVQAFGTIGGGGSDTINLTSPATELGKVKRRDGSNQAVFTISGTITDAGVPPTSILYDIDGGADQVLDAAPTATFSGNVTVTDQQVVTVKWNNNGAITDSVRLTAAMYILGWGESTQAGRGTSNQTVVPTGNNPTPLMYKSGTVSDLTDPTGVDGSAAGSHWPRIAQLYSDAGVPVLIANLGQGSATLSLWTKTGTYYTSVVNAAAALGGFDLALSIIGANDQSVGTAQATMETQLGSIVDDLFTDYGLTTYVAHHPAGNGIAGTPTAVRAAFDAVIAANANARNGGDLNTIDIDTGTTAGNDGIHLKSSADLTTAGTLIYNALNALLSTLNLSITGIPDGSFMTVLDDAAGNRLDRSSRTYASGASVVSLPVAVGTTVKGYVDDASAVSTNGAYIEGVTV